MIYPTSSKVWRDYKTDGVSATGAHEPVKADIRAWASQVEVALGLAAGAVGMIFPSRDLLYADLAHPENSSAWVLGDAVVAYDGVYLKSGASGTGSWSRVADLPYSVIDATDAGTGTADAIAATSALPISSSAIIRLTIGMTNTGSPVTVSFNGGSALTIKTNTGADVAPGGLVSGMVLLGFVSGSTFRLLSDQVSGAVLAAAEAAAADAATARDEALAAATALGGLAGIAATAAAVSADAGTAVAASATAVAAKTGAEAARDAAVAGSSGMYPTTAAALGRGIRGIAITTAGSGGTNGTATWVASGGTAVIAATGTATISGGAVVSITTDQPGYYTADPTGITLTGAGSLTGATFALTIGVNTPVGAYFSVPSTVSGEAMIIYRVDAGPVATEVTRTPASSGVAANSAMLNSATVGYSDVSASGTATSNTVYWYWPDTISTVDRWAETLEIPVTTGGNANIVVAMVNGDGTLSAIAGIPPVPVTLAAGVNTISGLDIYVPAGAVLGAGGRTGFYYSSGATTIWSTTVVPTTSTAKTISTSNPLHIRWKLTPEVPHKARVGYAASTANSSALGTTKTAGWPAIIGTGSNVPQFYAIALTDTPATADGYVPAITIGSPSGGSVDVMVANLSGTTITAIGDRKTITVPVGSNPINTALRISAGQVVIIQANNSGAFAFQNSANPLGIVVGVHSGSTLAVGQTVAPSTLHRYEVSATIASGLTGTVAAISHGVGTVPAAPVAGTGGDETAAFTAASAPSSTAFVPAGTDAITALAATGHGLWGPGKLYLSGMRWPLPMRPTSTTMLTQVQANLMEHAANSDVIALVGDSISHWSSASAGAKHWFNMLTAWLNYGQSVGDEPVMTALRPSSTYDPSFYGVSYTGTITTGTTGPLGESAILAAGAVLTFTGAYEAIGFWAEQASGAGTVTVARAGVTIGIIAMAGVATHDVYSGDIATGNPASATYTLTVSGAPVEVTGLLRLGILTTGRRRFRTGRFAHGSYTFASFSAARRASIIKQCTYAGGVAVPILALGINDAFGTDPATIIANATALIDDFTTAGAPRIFALPPMRPTSTWDASYTGGRTFGPAHGALRRLYRQRGVIILPVDGIDMAGIGGQQDGLHPNDAGNDAMLVAAAERLAAL